MHVRREVGRDPIWRGPGPLAASVAMAFVAVAACGAVAAPANGGSRPAEPTLTLQGTVTVAPTCPVVRAGSPCPRARLAGAKVEALLGRNVVSSVITDGQGRYVMRLTAGDYVVRVANPGLPHLVTRREVRLTGDAVLDLTVDSGIR